MIVFPGKEAREYFEEVATFAKKYNLWVAMPQVQKEIDKLTHRDRGNRQNNLNTKLEHLATYAEHWSTRRTITETYDGQTGESDVKVEERKWQVTFTRCLLFKDTCSSFMGFEFIIETWGRDWKVGRDPSEDEYKLRTYLSPEEVKEIVDTLGRDMPEVFEGVTNETKWQNLDYWLEYGCRWEELPGNTGVDHWIRNYNGGLIFDGPGYPNDGSFPQLTVSLADVRTSGWGIHT